MTFKTYSETETIELGKKIGSFLKKGDVLALEGTLAAGKTYFTKGIAQGLGIKEEITSPTFTLVSEYYGKLPLYHFDVYRLFSTEEFLDIGGEEFLYGEGVCVIEWSEKIRSELPENTIFVFIKITEDGSREIEIKNCHYNLDGDKN